MKISRENGRWVVARGRGPILQVLAANSSFRTKLNNDDEVGEDSP